MKKYLLVFFLFFSVIKASYAQSNGVEINIPSCAIPFKFNKDVVNEEMLNKCISKINLKDVIYIDIFATSSPEGGLAYNHNLSHRRANNIKKALARFNVPVNIKNGGSSHVYGRQGTITFLIHRYNDKVVNCPVADAPPKCVVTAAPIIEDHTVRYELYFGSGMTFISQTPLSDYTSSQMLTYQFGLIHKLTPFKLLGGKANTYLGGDISLAYSQRTLPEISSGSTIVSPKSDVRYLRNNYALIFGVEREFANAKSLSAYADAGIALQERIFIMSVNAGPTQNGYVARMPGAVADLGIKYNFLNNNSVLTKTGIENLFVKLGLNGSYGLKMTTDALLYKPKTEAVDINQFSWAALLSVGFAY